jgi:hypothetical protein
MRQMSDHEKKSSAEKKHTRNTGTAMAAFAGQPRLACAEGFYLQ